MIYYKGVYYTLSPEHKIVFSGNFETYPNRFFHRFMQEYAETIIFSMPLDAWIQEQIIAPILQPLALSVEFNQKVGTELLWAFNHIKDFNPLIEVSLRDVKALAQRFVLHYRRSQEPEAAIRLACSQEFSPGISDAVSRDSFNQKLGMPAAKQDSLTVIDYQGLLIPSSKMHLIATIEDDFQICEQAVKDGMPYRYGVLLEGGSAAGKTSIFKAVLEKHGYKNEEGILPANRYYEITADDSESAAYIILTAFFRGSKLLLNELNLTPQLEDLLIQLLEGEIPDQPEYAEMIKNIAGDHPVPVPGFYVMATQNPGTMTGCKAVSMALLNRYHRIYSGNYNNDELKAILTAAQVYEPADACEQFAEARKREPDVINNRKLFEWMRKPEAKLPRVTKAAIAEAKRKLLPVQPVVVPMIPVIVEPGPLPEPEPQLPAPLPAPEPQLPAPVIIKQDVPAEPLVVAAKSSTRSIILKWSLIALITLAVTAAVVLPMVFTGGIAAPVIIAAAFLAATSSFGVSVLAMLKRDAVRDRKQLAASLRPVLDHRAPKPRLEVSKDSSADIKCSPEEFHPSGVSPSPTPSRFGRVGV